MFLAHSNFWHSLLTELKEEADEKKNGKLVFQFRSFHLSGSHARSSFENMMKRCEKHFIKYFCGIRNVDVVTVHQPG